MDRTRWQDLVPHRDDTFIQDFEVFERFIALTVRTGGLQKISIQPFLPSRALEPCTLVRGALAADPRAFFISSEEPAYSMDVSVNPELDTDIVRYTYSSLTTPTTVYDYNVRYRREATAQTRSGVGRL